VIPLRSVKCLSDCLLALVAQEVKEGNRFHMFWHLLDPYRRNSSSSGI